MGRPRKNIDPKLIERLAGIGCTVAEIATSVDCSVRTLETRFFASIEKGRARGKRSLRRMQWKNAKVGNVTMQIWLGKQLLSQKDKQEISADPNAPPRIVVEYVETPVAKDN